MNFFMNPAEAGYDEAKTTAFYRDLVVRLRALPGVESASLAHSTPLGYYNVPLEIEREGQGLARDERGVVVDFNAVDEAYQKTMGIPLLRGHWLEFRSLRVLHVRTAGEPERLAPAVRKEVAALAPDVALFDVASMRAAVGGGNGCFLVRLAAQFAGALGLLGLALAVVGLYGVVAYSAGQRTHEIGIRVALGAGRRDVLAMIVKHGLWLVAAGGAVGLVAALGLSRLVVSLLFDVTPHDPLTYAVVTGVLALAATVACYLPARRATRVEPTAALRGE